MEKKEINASVAIQVLPNVVGNEEIVRVVDEVIAFIKSKGLKMNVAPFETTIEGDFDELMEIVMSDCGCEGRSRRCNVLCKNKLQTERRYFKD